MGLGDGMKVIEERQKDLFARIPKIRVDLAAICRRLPGVTAAAQKVERPTLLIREIKSLRARIAFLRSLKAVHLGGLKMMKVLKPISSLWNKR